MSKYLKVANQTYRWLNTIYSILSSHQIYSYQPVMSSVNFEFLGSSAILEPGSRVRIDGHNQWNRTGSPEIDQYKHR